MVVDHHVPSQRLTRRTPAMVVRERVVARRLDRLRPLTELGLDLETGPAFRRAAAVHVARRGERRRRMDRRDVRSARTVPPRSHALLFRRLLRRTPQRVGRAPAGRCRITAVLVSCGQGGPHPPFRKTDSHPQANVRRLFRFCSTFGRVTPQRTRWHFSGTLARQFELRSAHDVWSSRYFRLPVVAAGSLARLFVGLGGGPRMRWSSSAIPRSRTAAIS